MEKYIGSIKVNTETELLFYGDLEIKCPYDIHKAYETLCTFGYLQYTYSNDEETLWEVARETIEIMQEVDYPISENEAIEIACDSLNITLDEE